MYLHTGNKYASETAAGTHSISASADGLSAISSSGQQCQLYHVSICMHGHTNGMSWQQHNAFHVGKTGILKMYYRQLIPHVSKACNIEGSSSILHQQHMCLSLLQAALTQTHTSSRVSTNVLHGSSVYCREDTTKLRQRSFRTDTQV